MCCVVKPGGIALSGTGSSASNTYAPEQEMGLWQHRRVVQSKKAP